MIGSNSWGPKSPLCAQRSCSGGLFSRDIFPLRNGPLFSSRRRILVRRTPHRCEPSEGASLSIQRETPSAELAPAGESSLTQRPEWLPPWFPEWLIKKRHPLIQLVIMLILYAFHIFYLSKVNRIACGGSNCG